MNRAAEGDRRRPLLRTPSGAETGSALEQDASVEPPNALMQPYLRPTRPVKLPRHANRAGTPEAARPKARNSALTPHEFGMVRPRGFHHPVWVQDELLRHPLVKVPVALRRIFKG
ncbi:MAG: hypothetical protein JWQ49_5641 [Edaphobacter sp.]|nr:hypothetical protein [Edaphobacter sp.]